MRDCANCIRSKGATQWDNGCTSWDCDFIDRAEAIKVYKEFIEAYSRPFEYQFFLFIQTFHRRGWHLPSDPAALLISYTH